MDHASSDRVLTVTDDLPVGVARPVHSGKVRSVYCLTEEASRRLIRARAYPVPESSPLALMVISDRLSAFDCLWRGKTLRGVPGKGAALNAIAAHWFAEFTEVGLGAHHLLEAPHPLLWVVRQARPVLIEAIARRYLTGSLWRAYARGERRVGGVDLPDGLEQYGQLPQLLFTPSTKGIIEGVPGVEPVDDAPLDPAVLRARPDVFGLNASRNVDACMEALQQGFEHIEAQLKRQDKLLVDTKFEFGFAPSSRGDELIVMDEVGTPDSSRIWELTDWARGAPRERSKEQFREALLAWVDDPDVLLNPARMAERKALAETRRVPDAFMESLAETYEAEARILVGRTAELPDRPRESLLDVLAGLDLLT